MFQQINTKTILILILILGFFFRVYKLEIFYPWGHDQDLFAWIAKDILIDRHFRLIGQETSITGVFIGPLFYYLIALCFFVFKMNPLSAAFVTTMISLFTIFSIYWVFKKFFGNKVGLIGSFLYAVSPGTIFLDRWIVPTQPTILWTIWFLYVLFSILKGNFQILILLAILTGLIWHVHIAFIPLLVLLPVAFLLSDKKRSSFKYSLKTIFISLFALIILTLPFFAFEIRHGFIQTKSLVTATYQPRGDLEGFERFVKVINSGGRSLIGAFVLSNTAIEVDFVSTEVLLSLLFLGIFYLYTKKELTTNQTLLITFWIFLVFFTQFFSKRIITEYYFNNLFVILFLTLALTLSKLQSYFGKIPIVLGLLLIYFMLVVIWITNRPDDLGGYLYKRQAIEYIENDFVSKGFPCIAINNIENYKGGATGYRYLFWYNNLRVITGGNDVPVYNIVHPWSLSASEVTNKFGQIGIIVPDYKNMDSKICRETSRQLLPLWGFTN